VRAGAAGVNRRYRSEPGRSSEIRLWFSSSIGKPTLLSVSERERRARGLVAAIPGVLRVLPQVGVPSSLDGIDRDAPNPSAIVAGKKFS